MKTFLKLACSICLATLFAGCAVYTPAGALVVDPGAGSGGQQRGGFCPPGQAKKGNC